MPTLYLTEPRSLVRLRGDCLEVQVPADPESGRAQRSVEVPLLKIDDVVVTGEVTMTASAIGALLERAITVCYLGYHGQYRGTLVPEGSKHAALRIAQHRAYADDTARLVLARLFVRGKLQNMRAMLMRQNRTLSLADIDIAADRLRAAVEETERVGDVPSLLGVEGAGSAAYFGVFELLLRQRMGFEKRLRRPPPDPVNALLSFGYALLAQKASAAVHVAGLDPYIGYLHAPRYGRASVALDIMEEFRPILVDSVVLTAVNRGVIGPDDFVQELGSCRLSDRGRRAFFEQWEARLIQEIGHPTFGQQVTYRRCIELQARLLGKALLGDVPAYIPFTVR